MLSIEIVARNRARASHVRKWEHLAALGIADNKGEYGPSRMTTSRPSRHFQGH